MNRSPTGPPASDVARPVGQWPAGRRESDERSAWLDSKAIVGCRVGHAASEVVDRLLPLPQGDVRVAPAAIKPLEVGRGLGCLLGKGFDGRRVVGQLGLRIGPLAGELGTQLEQPGVARLSSEPFIDRARRGCSSSPVAASLTPTPTW